MRAASSSSCGSGLEEADHDPDHDRQGDHHVGERDRPDGADQAQHLEQGEQRDQVGQARRHAAEQQHGAPACWPWPWRCRSPPARPAAAPPGWPSRSPAPSSRSRGTSGFLRRPWRSCRRSPPPARRPAARRYCRCRISTTATASRRTRTGRGPAARRRRAASATLSTTLRICCRPRLPWTPFAGRVRAIGFRPTSPSARAHRSTRDSATMMAKNTTTTAEAVPHLVVGEGLGVEIDVQHLRGGAGTAVGDHPDRLERLQRINGADDQRHDEEGQHQRIGDLPEHLPLRRRHRSGPPRRARSAARPARPAR